MSFYIGQASQMFLFQVSPQNRFKCRRSMFSQELSSSTSIVCTLSLKFALFNVPCVCIRIVKSGEEQTEECNKMQVEDLTAFYKARAP